MILEAVSKARVTASIDPEKLNGVKVPRFTFADIKETTKEKRIILVPEPPENPLDSFPWKNEFLFIMPLDVKIDYNCFGCKIVET